MGIRRAAYPGTMNQAMSPVVVTQKAFGGGMNSDDPATDIAADELTDLFNKIAYQKFMRGRSGCRLMGSVRLPVIESYPAKDIAYIGASKVGSKVSFFPYEDGLTPNLLVLGQYLVWPDRTRDMITTITTGSGDPYFISTFSGNKTLGDCYQQSRLWGAAWSDQNSKIVIHLGTKLYFIGNDFAEYTEISCVGTDGQDSVAESRTRFDQDDDQLIAFNANGIYRIVFDENTAYYFKINSGQPNVRIYEDPVASPKEYVRNRIYTALRITGPGCLYSDRRDLLVNVQQETAPVLPDSNHKDMSVGYTDLPIGTGKGTYEELASGPGLDKDPTHYAAYNDASFGATMVIDGTTYGPYDILTDCSSVNTMDDLAAAIQASLRRRAPFADAECFYRSTETTQQLVITPGRFDGRQMEFVTTPATGTDITALLDMGGGTGNGEITVMPVDAPQRVFNLNIAVQKFTHLGIYASKNASESAINSGNIADLLIWAKDIPIIKTFRATRYSNILSVVSGEKLIFREDKGSYFTWADDSGGNRVISYFGNLIGPDLSTESNNEREAQAYNAGSIKSAATPIAIGAKKLSQAYQVGDTVYLDKITYDNVWNLFSASDEGKILFLEDGSVRHILSVNLTDQTCKVHEEIDFGAPGTSPEYEAVAWDPILHSAEADCGEDLKIVTFDKNNGTPGAYDCYRIGGDAFDVSDEGKKIYIFQGDSIGEPPLTATINVGGFLDADHVQVTASSDTLWRKLTDKSVTGILTSFMPSRFFDDSVTDYELDSRVDDPYFVLQTRFFRPLPSSCIGAIGSNFLFVAEQTTNKIKYSEMPESQKYIVGFYHPSWQADSRVQDEITYLKGYPDRMVAFCRKSVWGSNTSAFTSIKAPDIGEEIFTVPIFTPIGDYGLVHLDSIQDISVGQSILLCEDASVRSFDGRQFSDLDYSQNKVHKTLRLWHTRVMSSYDGVGGYMLFGSPNVSSDSRNYVNMSTGACYRLAVLPSQGQWWSRYGGLQMVSPYPYTGGLSIDDSNDMTIQVVLDERTGQWFQINTYNGPAGSGLVETFVDKNNTEIALSVKGMVHRGQRESISLEHMESHIHIAPLVQGQAYRTGFMVTSKIYVDNGVTYFAKTVNTPIDGDVSYDRKAQSKHLQNEFELATSAVVVSEIETIYNTKDTAGATAMDKRPTSESTHQRSYSGQ